LIWAAHGVRPRLVQERLHEAFVRILKRETNYEASLEDAWLLGVYEHFYDANSFGDENFGTHYVVLAHELKLADASALKSDAPFRCGAADSIAPGLSQLPPTAWYWTRYWH
jgi:hypothetical protein